MNTTPSAPARDPSYELPEVRRVQPSVDAAADRLLSRGVPPTVSLVRAEIGGGSPNAVAPALRYWRERRDRALGRDRSSESIPSPVLVAARALYDAALDVASRAAGTSQVELAAQLEAARAKSETLAAELKHVRRELETLRAERASVFEAAGRTHTELINAQALAAHCATERRIVQQRLDATQNELGKAQARIDTLEAAAALKRLAASSRKETPRTKAVKRTALAVKTKVMKRGSTRRSTKRMRGSR